MMAHTELYITVCHETLFSLEDNPKARERRESLGHRCGRYYAFPGYRLSAQTSEYCQYRRPEVRRPERRRGQTERYPGLLADVNKAG